MKTQPGHPIRISDSLWNLVGQMADELGIQDGRGAHSTLIREVVSAAAAEWNESPYVCRSARNVVMVTGNGDVFYWQLQELKLNSARLRLPCSLPMKPEKRDYFRESCPGDINQSDWFRSRWLINCFAVWEGLGINGSMLSSHSDDLGTDLKAADLEINQVRGRLVTREVVAAIKDYVQWREGGPSFDRVEFPIDIPTRNLEIIVVVDEELYRRSSLQMSYEIPNLELEFRNREAARFIGKEIAFYSENQVTDVHGHFPDKRSGVSDRDCENMISDMQLLIERVRFFAEHQTAEGPLLDGSGKERLYAAIKVPERFLFYIMKWPSPHLGLEVCVGWEKPVRE